MIFPIVASVVVAKYILTVLWDALLIIGTTESLSTVLYAARIGDPKELNYWKRTQKSGEREKQSDSNNKTNRALSTR